MYEDFLAYMTSATDLPATDIRQMYDLATFRKMRRKQYLLQEGEVSRHKIFVLKGLLFTYRRKEDGTESIMRFAPENTWTLDTTSYHNNLPTKFNIEALEDSEVLTWKKEDFVQLQDRMPALRDLSEKLRTSSQDASQDRILMNISYTSEEKYQEFVNTFPDLFRRIPLHMVASYLGVSRETLSRIRQAQFRQQKG